MQELHFDELPKLSMEKKKAEIEAPEDDIRRHHQHSIKTIKMKS